MDLLHDYQGKSKLEYGLKHYKQRLHHMIQDKDPYISALCKPDC